MRKQILAVVFLAICPLLYAQQALNNDAVIKLVKAGLSDDLIVSTISATAGSYDTSADGLIALKTAGASDKIVVAIVAKTAAPEPPAAAAPATPATAQVGTTATVHVYRFKEFIGQALHPSIYCDGVQLGRLGNGHYLDFQIAAGKHTLSADDKKAGAEVTLEAGKEYFFHAYLNPGAFKGSFILTMVMPEQGKYEITMLKP